jgi:acetyl esterase/lipase
MTVPRAFLRRSPIAALLSILAALPLAAQTPPAATQAPGDVELLADLTYGRAGDVELKLDLALPREGTGPFPAVVFIHGGGWHGGSRKQYTGIIQPLARQGYASATVDYRLAPKHPFPAQVEDVKCAVRWLRANAERHRIDPGRIGAVGDSAGGHLVAMLGTTSKEDGLEGAGGCADQSSHVQAYVAFYGPFDMTYGYARSETQPAAQAAYLRTVLHQWLGGPPDQVPERYKAASPVTYVTKDDAPALLLHGTADNLVLPEQSERFEKALREAGVDVSLVRLEGAGHGFRGKDQEKAMAETKAFLDRHLRGPGGLRRN